MAISVNFTVIELNFEVLVVELLLNCNLSTKRLSEMFFSRLDFYHFSTSDDFSLKLKKTLFLMRMAYSDKQTVFITVLFSSQSG